MKYYTKEQRMFYDFFYKKPWKRELFKRYFNQVFIDYDDDIRFLLFKLSIDDLQNNFIFKNFSNYKVVCDRLKSDIEFERIVYLLNNKKWDEIIF